MIRQILVAVLIVWLFLALLGNPMPNLSNCSENPGQQAWSQMNTAERFARGLCASAK